jgi:molybdenum cofactor cytidylyltransferase
MISAVILAAGKSDRMGAAKLLLPYGRTTIIETVIERVVSSKVDRTAVVLGSHWRTLKELIKKYPVLTAVNLRFKQGMLSSIQRGIAALPQDCRAAVIVLGDQPDIGTGVINRLIDAYHRNDKGIVVPVYGENRGHPVLIDLKFREEIAVLNPEIGLRELLHRHPEEILEVRAPDSCILLDIDTPADYQKALEIKKKR